MKTPNLIILEILFKQKEIDKLNNDLGFSISKYPFIKVNRVQQLKNSHLIGRTFRIFSMRFVEDEIYVETNQNISFKLNDVECITQEEYNCIEDNKVVSLDDYRKKVA